MREKSNLLILAVVVAFFAMTAKATADPYVCGDADGNEIVNVADAVYLITYIFGGGPAPVPLLAGDADGNEIVNVADVVYVIAYIFGGGPAPICECGLLIDIDGNSYATVKIGDQCWMAENLKMTHYRNGDSIPRVTDALAWSGLSSGAYCECENDPVNVETYGRLYNWFAVDDSRGLAPAGWHVPSDDEWKQLEMYLGMSQAEADSSGWRGTDEGGKLKEAGTTHWNPPNEGASNESGFTALPGGERSAGGDFGCGGNHANFWSSTEYSSYSAWTRSLQHSYSQVYRYDSFLQQKGFSVRCVRD